jgi:hypothetical protein
VCLCGVESNFAALIAIGSVCGPCSLVPPVFESLSHLSDGERGDSKCEKGRLSEHDE